jgi:hypothetical protein
MRAVSEQDRSKKRRAGEERSGSVLDLLNKEQGRGRYQPSDKIL